MVHVHFLINKLNIEHIIALGGKKINEKIWEKIEKQGNRWKNVWEAAMEKTCRLPTAQSAHQIPVRAAYSHNSPYPGRRRSARGQASEIACIFHI